MNPKLEKTIRPGPTVPRGAPRVRLTVSADETTAEFETCGPVTVVGSRRDCDLFIRQSDISKVHCALVNTGSAIVVADLCSRTGTFVGGRSVDVATLRPGDELRVGSISIDVQFLNPPVNSPGVRLNSDDANTSLATPLMLTGGDQSHELMTLPAVVGRRHSSQVLLDTPDVSLAHTLLFTVDGCPAVFDLGSRSGTILNGARVTLAWLNDGDQLCIGGETLAVAWQGAQCASNFGRDAAPTNLEAAGLAGALRAKLTPGLDGTDNLDSMVEDLKAQIDTSQVEFAARATALDAREAELKLRKAALERERAILEREERKLEQRKAEFNTEVAALRAREVALERRRAALVAAETEFLRRQAELAEREVTGRRSGPGIDECLDEMREVRRLFAAAEMQSKRAAPSVSSQGEASDPAGGTGGRTPSETDNAPTDDSLPAPLVTAPLFTALDGNSTEQWPQELRDRVRFLRTVTHMSEADVIAKVLAEYQAQHVRPRGPRRS